MGEWDETPKFWKWKSFTKVTLPIAVRHNGSYDDMIASIIEGKKLDCELNGVMDVGANGFRPILRINVIKRAFEEPLNSSPFSSRCLIVDDDLNDYENDGDHSMNMEDDSIDMEYDLLDS
ncbi:hypothetical protein T459_16540 [Capsicum annuum]|uniref:Uncharacterized protein n=1 Tax=Capsicum annuum TaxID=4072 RepID=A0A2G2Z911_CAPAN|nr:hypothetical protein T459_16540 [Capsicum annuum]